VTNHSEEKQSRREHWEAFWDGKPEAEGIYSNEDRILRNLGRVMELRGKKILEIGAGTGRDSFPLAREGASVIQLDYAENSLLILKQLAQREHLQTHIVGGNTFQLPFKDETFDAVFHQGLLEHFRKPYAERLLKENVRVLKRGGYLLVDVPQRFHLYTLAKHVLIAVDKWFAGWERSFSLWELKRELRSLGLTTVYAYGEWMVPSFIYRVTREVLKKLRVTLPMYPRGPKAVRTLRGRLRKLLFSTKLPLLTGISIGVVGKKEVPSQ
jgi:ubiquinone/menaquinone biosynthesis C-methylase UbiE